MAKKSKPISPAQAKALQRTEEEAERKIKTFNALVDVAEEQLKNDIRKKSAAKHSSK